ncbi:hypothetical protein TSUD_214840 [Trifolium subterraneum]|uniref:UspA domain-containing protein n=1 Tax=Trifolium subterraneum TaxID=3900 RepID=A0A2Z6MGM4_TRISU|nr:hypothetical protein TSUD_214840 [Trifolium subterraneum]
MGEEVTRIMIGVNESSLKGYPNPSISSKGAFEWTINKIVRNNVSAFNLLFLHVHVPDQNGYENMDSIYASNEDFKNMKQKEMVRRNHLLEYFVNRCNEIGVPCAAWIKEGDPKEVILNEVKRIRPDLLVVGSRGLGPFKVSARVLVGTVSEFCWKHAECPVMTIKRNADETPRDPVDD